VTAIHKAAFRRDLATVEFLVNHGADLNIVDSQNSSALIYALRPEAEGDAHAVASYLISAGCDVTIHSVGNVTPHYAAERGYLDVVLDILNAEGVELEVRDANGYTPAFTAVHARNVFVMEALINAGADLACVDAFGVPLIRHAIGANQPEMLGLLENNIIAE